MISKPYFSFLFIILVLFIQFSIEDSSQKVEGKENDEPYNRFIEWLTSNEVIFENCEIGIGNTDPGVFALDEIIYSINIKPFIKIPKQLLMTSQNAFDSSIGGIFHDYQDLINGGSILAVFLLYERFNPSSFWKPYLDVLPKELEIPMFWKEEERELLKGTWVLDRINADHQGITEDYERIFPVLFEKYPHLFKPEIFTLENYLWSWCTIWGRGFWFDSSGQILIPLIDRMANAPSKTELRLDEETGDIVLYIQQDHKKNSEITFYRGDRSNNDLLRLYGMIPKDNPNNIVFLNIHIPGNDPHYRIKEALLNQYNLNTPPYPYSDAPTGLFVSKKGAPLHVISYLRVKYWEPNQSELDIFYDEGIVPAVSPLKKISDENEIKVIRELVKSIETALGRYPTVYKDDEKNLKNKKLSVRERLAISVIYQEKIILNKAREAIMRSTTQENSSDIL